MKFNNLIFTLLFSFFVLSCSGSDNKLGSKNNPIKFYFTPSSDAQNIISTSRTFIEFMERETGLYFESAVPTSFIAVVEAFGSNRADIAIMNSFGYLLAHQKYGAEARLTTIRYGVNFYSGAIITRVDSGINKIEDLEGKKFAFTDSASTSGYLFPLKMIKEKNVKLGNTVFAMKHDNVVTMVYQKQVDAGACYYSEPGPNGELHDARAKVLTQFPDVAQKTKVIAVTDKILNDPVVFRKEIPEELKQKIINSIYKFLSNAEGKQIFNRIYNIEGVISAQDKDYQGLRDMVKINNINPEDMLKKN